MTEQKGLMQDNHNYLFVKRFTAKEEPRRLQCGVYLSKKFPQYSKISTQNKVNSTEINAMPVPDINIIQEMGRKIMKSKDMSEKNCNIILEGYCG